MNKFISPLKTIRISLFALALLYSSTRCAAQAIDSIKNIPTNVKQATNDKVVAKSNSVTKDALTLADSTSNKVFRSMKGMFKKKPHPAAAAPAPGATTTAPAGATPPATAPGAATTAPAATKDSTTGHPAGT